MIWILRFQTKVKGTEKPCIRCEATVHRIWMGTIAGGKPLDFDRLSLGLFRWWPVFVEHRCKEDMPLNFSGYTAWHEDT